ncbi:Glu/Leu/Phe/Val family dehydrogenase [Pseudooceanicola aestuarii]|uniref:Glu/Leu/Phe/Val family dehydrogenase n=1 Tax=Pseudooceanicola aestuarii TaxID=2697319 RepID=UPI0013D18E49
MPITIHEETPPPGVERLVRAEDPASGLRALICVHSTALGPAAGGCRMWDYPDWNAARADVLRLAEGMTRKTAMADLGLGGGKAVILGNPHRDKTPALLRAFGRAVDALEGQYFTAEDVGMSADDMAVIAQETRFAVGLDGGAHGSGDPSPFTAEGVFECLRAGAEVAFGSADLTGRRVMVQGLGHVGTALAARLHGAGAQLLVSDLDAAAVERAANGWGAQPCAPDAVLDQPMDIFAPCAMGGVLTGDSAQRLGARLVCGAANNQLATPEVAEVLRARGIHYLPDYVVNAGGIISVAGEIHRAGPGYRSARLGRITTRLRDVLHRSAATGQTTTAVADRMVDDILAAAG